MSFLLIALAIAAWTAFRQGRPVKLVLSPEEAQAVKARWWASAKAELRVWAIAFVIGCALLGNALASAHWSPLVYLAIVWASLMLFSRLAIWITVACGILLYALVAITTTIGHPICPIMFAILPLEGCLFAIIIRCPVMLWCASGIADSARMAHEHVATLTKELHEERDRP